MRFWRRRDPDVPDDTGGKQARERAEKALEDVRHLREEQAPLRRFFRVDASENHYGQGATQLFLGRKP